MFFFSQLLSVFELVAESGLPILETLRFSLFLLYFFFSFFFILT